MPLLFFFPSMVLAQSLTVSGTVTDEQNEPLIGVAVTIKNTAKGAITGSDGRFTIQANASDSLLVSYYGYVRQTVGIAGRSSLTIAMVSSDLAVSEVVIVGYGTQRKAETTGAIASVKASEITQTPVANLAQGLQARVSGVQVVQNSSAPGGNVSVRVRGTNSINGTSEPLYIIDGIQVSNSGGVNDLSPLSTINPDDIESMEVLKDASATAIYGSRGANGVVLITTKRGKTGGTRVSYDGYYGTQQITRQLDVLNATEFAKLENEIYKTTIYADPASLGQGVNWQDLAFRTASIQNHQLSMSGGNAQTQVSMSANYFDQDGIVINSDFKRYSFRVNLDHKINEFFKVGTSLLGTYSVNNRIPTGSTSLDGDAFNGSAIGAAIAAPPTLEPYRPDGTIYPFAEQLGGRYREVVNPLGLLSILNRNNAYRTLANVYVEAKIAKGLTYRASFNSDLQSALNNTYSPRYILATADQNANSGSASKSNSNGIVLLHESILTYQKVFATTHSLRVTGVFATQTNNFNSNNISASGFPNDATQNEALSLAVNRNISSFRSSERLDSYMARVNYGFKDRYFVDVTARIDGSSKFGANNKYGFFPAASVGWRIIEEDFLKDVTWLSDLKLRASYGITGNAGAIDPYRSLATVASGSDYQFNHVYTTGISPTGIANPSLRWEKSTQTNIGIDIGFLNDRISLVVDVYEKQTRDLLYVKTLPFSSGYPSILGNFAGIDNKGLEFATNIKFLEGAFKWSVSANASINRNTVTDLDGGVTNERFLNTFSIIKVGEPLGLFKTYVFDGIYQTGETVLPGSGSRTGGVKVKDLNNDGQITSDDQIVTGNPNPKFIYGFSTNMSYKGFDLAIFLSGSYGNDIFNLSRYSLENPLGQRNVLAGMADRWSETNPNNEYVSGFQGGRIPVTDRFVEDGSYLRCKNITLGYNLPKINKVSNIRVYFSANNLFTITKYTGLNPEVNSYGSSNTVIGVDNLVYPAARSFLGGIQIHL